MTYWLIDFGASRHMTGCHNLLVNILPISPISIDFPNGSHTIAIFERTVYLSSNIVLTHVLYVPNLIVNLLSISQLLDTHPHCSMYFTKWFCMIHDHATRMAIGMGKSTNGVFHFSRVQGC